jgi:hypothetical protein
LGSYKYELLDVSWHYYSTIFYVVFHCFMIVAMMAAIRFIWASLKQVFYHDQGCSFLDSSNTSIRYTKYNRYYL